MTTAIPPVPQDQGRSGAERMGDGPGPQEHLRGAIGILIGHRPVIHDIAAGRTSRKWGAEIGHAVAAVGAGDDLPVHNV